LQSITSRQRNAYRHKNAVLISKVSEKVATNMPKKPRRRQPHDRLTPPPRGTPANIRIHLTLLRTRLIELYFAPDSVCLSFVQCFSDGLRERFFPHDCVSAIQGHQVH